MNNGCLDTFYEQIDKLHDGDKRVCISCDNIFESQYFPYKTKDQCVNCYEKENGKTLWTFRKRLNSYKKNEYNLTNSNEYNNIGITSLNCPTCNSINIKNKGYRNDKKRLICGDCGRNWSVLLEYIVNDKVEQVSKKEEDNFERENSIDDINNYLNNKKNNNLPVSFYYKEKIFMEHFYDYYFDDKYLYIKSGYNKYYIKYLIDKIRRVV